jgi:hypothetical protein
MIFNYCRRTYFIMFNIHILLCRHAFTESATYIILFAYWLLVKNGIVLMTHE